MKNIQRDKDVINECKDLEFLYKFDNFPVFMGCTNQSIEKDILVNMQWEISKGSGVIQLNPLLPLDILYPESHGSGNIGRMWAEHHQEFSKFIQHQSPNSVLEIGGAHGILSREYKKENPINWTILEPNPSPAKDVDATFIKGFFDDKFTFDGEIDTIIHSHVFEHVYYPDEFIGHISSFLNNGQNLIFSLPNMEEMLKRKYTNCINFEHTVFITEPYVEHLLSKHGFKKVVKQYFKDDHSIFYAYIKDSNVKTINLPNNLYEYNKNLYLDYVDYFNKLIKEINTKISNIKDNRPIYLFGAHIFSQYLIEFGLDIARIECILDNDESKQGKRLYGSNLIVKSPKNLLYVKNPIVILKAGAYNKEISRSILADNSNTTFWE